MLTDSPYKKSFKPPRRRGSGEGSVQKHYSDSQKVEAVTTYFLLGGNLAETGRVLKINYETLKSWRKSNWWQEIEEQVRKQEKLEISSQLKKLMDKSWVVVADRLEHGDWVLNQKTGEVTRKPVSMRDANNVAKTAVELREKMDLAEAHTVATENINNKLNKLAEAFTKLSKGEKLEEAEDIAFVDVVHEKDDNALHEEREEGL
jgi:hypothetical protein